MAPSRHPTSSSLHVRLPIVSKTACSSSSGDSNALQPISIDVEYAHVEMPDGSRTSLAAYVCVLSPSCATPLLKSYCRHPSLDDAAGDAAVPPKAAAAMRSCGGVRMAKLYGAPNLQQVASEGDYHTEGWS